MNEVRWDVVESQYEEECALLRAAGAQAIELTQQLEDDDGGEVLFALRVLLADDDSPVAFQERFLSVLREKRGTYNVAPKGLE